MTPTQSTWGIDLSATKQHSVTYSTGREKKVCKIFYFWIQIEREDFDLKKILTFLLQVKIMKLFATQIILASWSFCG